jgi:hypothetical protein
VTNNTTLTSLLCEEQEGLPDAGREFIFHVTGDSDDSSDDSSESSCGDEEGQACADDIYAGYCRCCPITIDLCNM